MANEVTGLRWEVDLRQPTSTEDVARDVEQAVLKRFFSHRLASNGEILKGIDPMSVAVAVGTELRARRLDN
jgi:hypothetical protein